MTGKIVWHIRQSKITKEAVLASLGGKGLTLSQPEAPAWQVKSSGVRQSEITQGPVWDGSGRGLGGKGLTKEETLCLDK